MHYKVFAHYGRGSDMLCAQFKDLNDAKLFAEHKALSDASRGIKVIYRVMELDELMMAYDSAKLSATTSQTTSQGQQGQQGGQGKGSAITFTPTPFNMTPRPAGTPQNWVKDVDDGNNDKGKQ